MLVGILSILAAAGLMLVDQLIKLWATVELLPVGSKPFIPHVLEFYYLLNDGMSFSMLSGKRTLLVIITGVMLAVLAGMLLLRKMPRLERAAWILVVGGGVGNLIDRIRTGVVVDYLNCLLINFPQLFLISFCGKFKCHRSLPFERRLRPDSEDCTDCIEQTSRTGRCHSIHFPVRHGKDHFAFRFTAQVKFLYNLHCLLFILCLLIDQ